MTLDSIVKKMSRKYFITAFQSNSHVNRDVLNTVESLCRYHNIPEENLLLLKLSGKTVLEDETPKLLRTYNVLEKDFRLNKNFKISNFSVRPQQIRPFTGLEAFTRGEGSFIFGSPKQYLQPVPTYDKKHAKLLLTTGVISDPRYNLDNAIGRKAQKDHTFGGVLVEVINSKRYYARPIKITSGGIAYDLNKEFRNGQITTIRPEGLVLGDIHVGMTDPRTRACNYQMIKDYNPKNIFLHDFADFASINHHEEGKLIDKVLSYNENNLNLEQELKMVSSELKYMVEHTSKDTNIYIVKSNHDEFLYRYLQEARFIKEPQNALIASKLLTKAFEGYDPFEIAVNMYYNVPDRVVFLQSDDSAKIGQIECGKHGHKGVHGAKFSHRSAERSTPFQVVGHSHVPMIERNQIKVGTSTILDPRYAKGGLSAWGAGNALVYRNNLAQLITMIDGQYKN